MTDLEMKNILKLKGGDNMLNLSINQGVKILRKEKM